MSPCFDRAAENPSSKSLSARDYKTQPLNKRFLITFELLFGNGGRMVAVRWCSASGSHSNVISTYRSTKTALISISPGSNNFRTHCWTHIPEPMTARILRHMKTECSPWGCHRIRVTLRSRRTCRRHRPHRMVCVVTMNVCSLDRSILRAAGSSRQRKGISRVRVN